MKIKRIFRADAVEKGIKQTGLRSLKSKSVAIKIQSL
jgi:hypothetical protein